MVYLDDILIYSKDPSWHRAAVEEVLERLWTHKLYANLKKCVFNTDEVEFLRFIIGPKGLTMDPARVATVAKWLTPKSI